MEAPIPTPRQDDDEDVHWALSTAGALWARGEHAEALKWLRRAAEQASDVNADIRALELFKAAADVATRVNTPSAAPPPPAPAPAPAPVAVAPPPVPTPRPPAPGLPTPRGAAPPAPSSQAPAPKPSAPPPPPPAQRKLPDAGSAPKPPLPPPRPGSVYPPPPAVQAAPSPQRPSVPAPAPRPPQPTSAPRPAVNDGGAATRSPLPDGAAVKPQGAVPAKPPVPAAVTAPRAVAITTAKPAPPPPAATPKRRRSFTGEARPPEKARAAEPTRAHREPHRRRRTFEDEPTSRHPAGKPAAADEGFGLKPAVLEGAPNPPASPDPGAGFDDLDEDTRVLQYRPGGGTDDVIDQAFERLRTGTAPAAAPAAPPVAVPAAGPEEETLPPGTPAFARQTPDDANEEPSSGPPSQNTKVWTQLPEMDRSEPQTQRPASMADGGPQTPGHPAPAPQVHRRLDTLPALRVAVLATSVPGEVRLIALETKDEAPPGAALAVLVPLSAADGEAVARLFEGHD